MAYRPRTHTGRQEDLAGVRGGEWDGLQPTARHRPAAGAAGADRHGRSSAEWLVVDVEGGASGATHCVCAPGLVAVHCGLLRHAAQHPLLQSRPPVH